MPIKAYSKCYLDKDYFEEYYLIQYFGPVEEYEIKTIPSDGSKTTSVFFSDIEAAKDYWILLITPETE